MTISKRRSETVRSSAMALCVVLGVIGLAATATYPLGALAERCPRDRLREAEQHKQRGWELVEDDPGAAVDELEKAHELCPDSFYLGTLAVCYERLGRYRDAMKALDGYLEDPRAPQREQAAEARERLRKSFGTVHVASEPPGADVLIDGYPRLPRLSTPASIDLDPGEHTIGLALDGYVEAARPVVVEGGTDTRLAFTLEPETVEPAEPEPETEPEPERPERERELRWTGAGQLNVGGLFPFLNEGLLSSVGLGGDASIGVEVGIVRPELVAFVLATPDADGYLLEAGGGARVGVRLGTLPLTVETELLLGLCYVSVGQTGLVIPAGGYASLAFVPTLGLAWRPLQWLEVVARPVRLELLGLAGDLPGGFALRYGFDVGVRFRR